MTGVQTCALPIYKLFIKVIDYFSSVDISQIPHTLNVAYFTRLIASSENENADRINILETAAMFHDIGCPISKEKYGNSLPVNQEKEGKILTLEMLEGETWMSEKDKTWIAEVVGTHHQLKYAKELNFEPLFDADVIVNTLEGYFSKEKADVYIKMISTNTGKELYRNMFLQK